MYGGGFWKSCGCCWAEYVVFVAIIPVCMLAICCGVAVKTCALPLYGGGIMVPG